MSKIEIPFDSELQEQEIHIPEGFEASIEGGKIIFRKKESEDEKIRKVLVGFFKGYKEEGTCGSETFNGIPTDNILAWLEEQGKCKSFEYNGHIWGMCARNNGVDITLDGELKAFLSLENSFIYPIHPQPSIEFISTQNITSEAKVEPKFLEGDWAVSNLDGKARQISEVHFNKCNSYYVVEGKSVNLEEYDRLHHLWTIADAQDGDVLVDKSDGTIGIFQCIGHHPDGGSYNDPSYCYLHCRYDDEFFYADFENGNTMDSDNAIPATKEQHDLLSQKMEEAGWTWDDEKKELEQKPIDKAKSDTKQNLTWSEEDEAMCQETIDWFEQKCFPYASEEENPARKSIQWLKSLKLRQSKVKINEQCWSDEDENRQEEIIRAAEENTSSQFELEGFIEGAEWADANPDGKMLLHVLNKSAEQAKKRMIDRACEWLQKNADTYIGVEGLAILQDAFFEDFRKAMEE